LLGVLAALRRSKSASVWRRVTECMPAFPSESGLFSPVCPL
jgi:hypothetical protein